MGTDRIWNFNLSSVAIRKQRERSPDEIHVGLLWEERYQRRGILLRRGSIVPLLCSDVLEAGKKPVVLVPFFVK
jgi:hypothetical protein